MATATPYFTWENALQEYLLHTKATRAKKTVRYYEVQLGQLVKWANENDVPFESFGKRHLDRYLIFRTESGLRPLTVHHDAICAKAFFKWCARNEILDRSLIAEYEVRRAPRPARYMPTNDDIQKLLAAYRNFWDPAKRPGCRFTPVDKRIFHRDRNFAVLLGLVDSASRIGEMLSLKVDDFRAKEKQIVIRESKGREPRTLPISKEWAEAVQSWLKVRSKVMSGLPEGEDEGWLFIAETGARMDEGRFLKAMRTVTVWAELPDSITLHSLRRYSLNRLAKFNLLAAQQIAGHKETKTTILYTQLDADFVRDIHDQVGLSRDVLQSKRPVRKKRFV